MGWRRLQTSLAIALLTALALGGCVEQGASTEIVEEAKAALACPAPCAVAIDKGPRWEPAVTVDPSDGRRIVAASMEQGFDEQGVRYSWPLAHVSHDGGATWTTLRLPMGPEQRPEHPLFAYNHADDPMALFLADGTLLYTALTFAVASVERGGGAETATSIAMWRSTDGGLTFPEAEILFAGSGAASFLPAPGYLMHDKQWLTQGADGTVLMAWNTNEAFTARCSDGCTQVLTSASTDGGRSWSEPAVVYDGVASGAFPLVLDDGSWVVSYRETRDAAVHVAVSDDRGRTWTTNATIDSTTKFPVLAKTMGPGPSGERVYMAYPMTDEHKGQPDVPQVVTLRWSDDGGHTWSGAVALHVSEAAARTSPALAATPEGGAVVTHWAPSGEGAGMRAELRAVAVAADGSLAAPLTLGTHEGATRTTGDYMGLVALPGAQGAFAVWNARHGDGHVITGARLAFA